MVSFSPWPPYTRRSPSTHWIEGWVDPRDSLDDVTNRNLTLPGIKSPNKNMYNDAVLPTNNILKCTNLTTLSFVLSMLVVGWKNSLTLLGSECYVCLIFQ